MVSITLATILLALAGSLLLSILGFLAWWWFDQRRTWIVAVDGNRHIRTFKKKVEGDKVRLSNGDEEATVPLEPEKNGYMEGFRSGTAIIVDMTDGVQVDPTRTVNERRVGYDMAALIDSKFGEKWRGGFPKEDGWAVIGDFLMSYGWLFVLGFFAIIAIWLFGSAI